MDEPKERRFRFGLRTLLGVVALVGVGLHFRPCQVDPPDIPRGATKTWVYWNCGPPSNKSGENRWCYSNSATATCVTFDYDGNVESVYQAL